MQHKRIIQKNLKQMIQSSALKTEECHSRPVMTSSTHENQVEDRNPSLKRRQNSSLQRSCSKHSLKSKPKINCKIKTQIRQFSHEAYIPSLENKSGHEFNQIDAVFTDLEDYLYQMKEKIIVKLKQRISTNESFSKNNQQAKQFVQSLSYFAEEVKMRAQSFVGVNQDENILSSQPLSEISNTKRVNCMRNLTVLNQKKAKYQSRGEEFKNKKSIYEMVLLENKLKYQSCKKK